jgi:nucleoside-diphosphate-sugar epimerase
VDGFLRAGSVAGVAGETINLGSGTEIAIGTLAERIIALIGKPVRLETDAGRLRPARSEVMRLISDNRKAAALLGWRPTTSLDEGLARTIAWLRGELHRYKPGIYNV